jgi:hypothetical protein
MVEKKLLQAIIGDILRNGCPCPIQTSGRINEYDEDTLKTAYDNLISRNLIRLRADRKKDLERPDYLPIAEREFWFRNYVANI